ncbi:hypothetical protein BDW72DRAFT_181489 [Aspergillus terricola var. indicus]
MGSSWHWSLLGRQKQSTVPLSAHSLIQSGSYTDQNRVISPLTDKALPPLFLPRPALKSLCDSLCRPCARNIDRNFQTVTRLLIGLIHAMYPDSAAGAGWQQNLTSATLLQPCSPSCHSAPDYMSLKPTRLLQLYLPVLDLAIANMSIIRHYTAVKLPTLDLAIAEM